MRLHKMIKNDAIQLKLQLIKLVKNILQSQYQYKADIRTTRIIESEIEKQHSGTLSNLSGNSESRLAELAKDISSIIYNKMLNLDYTIAASKTIETIAALPQKMVLFDINHPYIKPLLISLLLCRDPVSKYFILSVLSDSLHVNNLGYKLPDGRVDERGLTLKIYQLHNLGLNDEHIKILCMLAVPARVMNPCLELNHETFLTTLKIVNPSRTDQEVPFSVNIRKFLQLIFKEFLFNVEEQRKKNEVHLQIENFPLLNYDNKIQAALPGDRELIWYPAATLSELRFYQFLRRNSLEQLPDLNGHKLALALDAIAATNSNQFLTFINLEQFLIAQTIQRQLLERRLKELLDFTSENKESSLEQIQYFINKLASYLSLKTDRVVNLDDIEFLKVYYATPQDEIGEIDEYNSDITTYGHAKFDLPALIQIFSNSERYKNFLTMFLHQFRLPNPLLRATLVIGKNYVQTGRKLTLNITKAAFEITQTLRVTNNSLYLAAGTGLATNIETVNTFGIQAFNLNYMSITHFEERIKILLAAGCSLNDCSPLSNTILHTLVVYEVDRLIEILFDLNKDAPEAQRINPNIQNNTENCAFPDGRTALHLAVQTFRPYKIIELLLKLHADPNIQDAQGATPLHYALALGRADIIVLLAKHNARFNIFDNRSYRPLDYLSDHTVHQLLNHPVASTRDAIIGLGFLSSMQYGRSVTATQNYLLVSPSKHGYFWSAETTGAAGDMQKKLLFPTDYQLYFDTNGNRTKIFVELDKKIDEYQCNEEDRQYIMRQINELDAELLIDRIMSARANLRLLLNSAQSDAATFLMLLKSQQKICISFNEQLDLLKQIGANSIQCTDKFGVKIEVTRAQGKYSLIISSSDKIIHHALGNALSVLAPSLKDESFLFEKISLSKIYFILDKLAQATKQSSRLVKVGYFQSVTRQQTDAGIAPPLQNDNTRLFALD